MTGEGKEGGGGGSEGWRVIFVTGGYESWSVSVEVDVDDMGIWGCENM